MSKIIKKNYKKIEFGSEGYTSLNEFREVSAETDRRGEIGITDCDGSKRVRIGSNLLALLENPVMIKVYLSDTQAAIKAVPSNSPGAYDVKKGGVVYSTNLAESIMALAPTVEFLPNVTTRCGSIAQLQTDEEGYVTAILDFQ